MKGKRRRPKRGRKGTVRRHERDTKEAGRGPERGRKGTRRRPKRDRKGTLRRQEGDNKES